MEQAVIAREAVISRPSSLSVEDIINLHALCDEYRAESLDLSRAPSFHLNRLIADMKSGMMGSLALWTLTYDGAIQGYAFTEIVRFAGQRSCFVIEAYIPPLYRNTSAVHTGLSMFEAWAKSMGCHNMVFGTHRSARAYNRLLKRHGWAQIETYFKKDLGDA